MNRTANRNHPGLYNGAGWAGLKIGVLGGSFNPAHAGHRHISIAALNQLGLDQVWWMVSPQNPLKKTEGMGAFQQRVAAADLVAQHPDIIVTDIESKLDSNITLHTMRRLKQLYARTDFVWLMGADNLKGFHCWTGWRRLARTVPIAVMARAGYQNVRLKAPAAQQMARYEVGAQNLKKLWTQPLPNWCYLPIQPHAESATRIRQKAGSAQQALNQLLHTAKQEDAA